MSDYRKLASDLITSLALAQPPVAISFADAPPPNVPSFHGVVPAGCSFWQQAAAKMFYTSTKNHELCAIGVHTHHLAEPSTMHQLVRSTFAAIMLDQCFSIHHEAHEGHEERTTGLEKQPASNMFFSAFVFVACGERSRTMSFVVGYSG